VQHVVHVNVAPLQLQVRQDQEQPLLEQQILELAIDGQELAQAAPHRAIFTIKIVLILAVLLILHVAVDLALDVRLAHVAAQLVEPYLQFRDPTDRLSKSVTMVAVKTTERIMTSSECGQLPTLQERLLGKLVNVEAPAVRKVALFSLLQ